MAIRFGVFDQGEQPGGLSPADIFERGLRLGERAEAAGFWGYHKSEHHLIPLDHSPSINMFFTALAARTTRLRLCSLVHILPFHHPLRLYEEICLLDHLSGGRFEFGFGKGVSAPEHTLWGLNPAEAAARTEEILAVLLAAFGADGRLDFDGDYYRFAGVPVELRPCQQPYPPLWRPGTLATAAELGVSTVVAGPTTAVHQSLARYRTGQRSGISGGHAPNTGVLRKYIVAPTDDQADQLGRRAWAAYTHNLGLLFRRFGVEIPNDPTVGGDYDAAKRFHVIVAGSPETVRAHVDELVDSELVDYLIGGFAFGDLNNDEVNRSFDLFCEHVVADLG